MVGLTLEIVAKTLFDVDIRGDANTIGEAMTVLEKAMVAHITMPLPVPSWWPSQRNKKKLAAIAAIEEIVRSVIADRRATGEDRGDLLSMLLLARDEDGDRLSDKELRDQSMTLIFAGHETSAHALTWAWYLLGTHPEITKRLQAEIGEEVGDRRLTVADLKNLPYLDQVFKESMRLRPSVWVFMKEPTQDVVVRGVKIPKGAQIMISPYVIQRDERWFPSPETFDPDRFSPERVGSIPPGAYVPFSGGQRICIGKTFAMMESRLILGSMVQRLNPRVQEGHRPVHKAELSMHPDGPLPIVVELR
jgi:cytochrome P450